MQKSSKRAPPSTKWTSLTDWDWGDWGPRLKQFLKTINKQAITAHASALIPDKNLTMSEPFSAGQNWCCFEMVADDDDETLVIARVQLPPLHPETQTQTQALDRDYRTMCEVATISYLNDTTDLPIPRVYAYEPSGSIRAKQVGAPYMLLEGLYGNSLVDVDIDLSDLPHDHLHRLMEQWTMIQTRLASITFPEIGAIRAYSPSTGPVLGPIATEEGNIGPFSDAVDYFSAMAWVRYNQAKKKTATATTEEPNRYHVLGPFLHLDIIHHSTLFAAHRQGPFPLNHMDIGTPNILIDEEYNIVGIIDWEMAQSAPWDVNYYHYPFPPADDERDLKRALNDPNHPAHKSYTKINALQQLYCRKMKEAEAWVEEEMGAPLTNSIADVLNTNASRAYFMMERHGVDSPVWDDIFARALVRMAFGLGDGKDIEGYINRKEEEMKSFIL